MAVSTIPTIRETVDPEIVALLPRQGEWSEADYLWLTQSTNHLVELVDGRIEVLPMPTTRHQSISQFMFLALHSIMQRIKGDVFFAPLRVRIAPCRFREPDLLLLVSNDDPRGGNEYWEGADLVVEIVSPDKPERDYVEKREDYARAGVAEYWIVDPQTWTITVLRLDGQYVEHGVWGRGMTATSALLKGYAVQVDEVFGASTQ
jgi:Uma2 family endonuclease